MTQARSGTGTCERASSPPYPPSYTPMLLPVHAEAGVGTAVPAAMRLRHLTFASVVWIVVADVRVHGRVHGCDGIVAGNLADRVAKALLSRRVDDRLPARVAHRFICRRYAGAEHTRPHADEARLLVSTRYEAAPPEKGSTCIGICETKISVTFRASPPTKHGEHDFAADRFEPTGATIAPGR